jgi:hypothetical protein
MSSTTMTVEWLVPCRGQCHPLGWPVTPGTVLGADLYWHGREVATALCPVQDTWARAPVTDPDQAEVEFAGRPNVRSSESSSSSCT